MPPSAMLISPQKMQLLDAKNCNPCSCKELRWWGLLWYFKPADHTVQVMRVPCSSWQPVLPMKGQPSPFPEVKTYKAPSSQCQQAEMHMKQLHHKPRVLLPLIPGENNFFPFFTYSSKCSSCSGWLRLEVWGCFWGRAGFQCSIADILCSCYFYFMLLRQI